MKFLSSSYDVNGCSRLYPRSDVPRLSWLRMAMTPTDTNRVPRDSEMRTFFLIFFSPIVVVCVEVF